MAHFRNIIKAAHGGRADVTRLAHNNATVIAQSWQGQVRTVLYCQDKVDMARVTLEPHGGGAAREIYNGPVNAWRE